MNGRCIRRRTTTSAIPATVSSTCWKRRASKYRKSAPPGDISVCWPAACSTGYNSSLGGRGGYCSCLPRCYSCRRRSCCPGWISWIPTATSPPDISAPLVSADTTFMDGVIVVDKPEGWTSHDVVNKVRGIARTKKVGHLGTLDPMATGVLPLVIERATRLAQFYTRSDKIYDGLVRFGWSTSTYDREGEPVGERRELDTIDAEELERHLEKFRGEFLQRPPAVSAKKVDGRRAYELARKNIVVELEPVKIHVD